MHRKAHALLSGEVPPAGSGLKHNRRDKAKPPGGVHRQEYRKKAGTYRRQSLAAGCQGGCAARRVGSYENCVRNCIQHVASIHAVIVTLDAVPAFSMSSTFRMYMLCSMQWLVCSLVSAPRYRIPAGEKLPGRWRPLGKRSLHEL